MDISIIGAGGNLGRQIAFSLGETVDTLWFQRKIASKKSPS